MQSRSCRTAMTMHWYYRLLYFNVQARFVAKLHPRNIRPLGHRVKKTVMLQKREQTDLSVCYLVLHVYIQI